MRYAKRPPFVASDDLDIVVNVEDCTTTLLFPFVTNQLGVQYRTGHHECLGGIWLNCTIDYSGRRCS